MVVDLARRLDDDTRNALAAMARECATHRLPMLVVGNKTDLLRGDRLSASLRDLADRRRAPATGTSRATSTEQEVAAFKHGLLVEAFEAAAFNAGLIGPGGFDAPPTASTTSAASRVYSLVPPIFLTSATHGEGVDSLSACLVRLAVPREWEYPRGTMSDRTPLERVTDAVREQLFCALHDEVPYQIVQVNRSWATNAHGELVIDQEVQVPSTRVARMLTARRGGPIKAVTSAALRTLAGGGGMEGKVHLFLHLVVKEGLRVGGNRS